MKKTLIAVTAIGVLALAGCGANSKLTEFLQDADVAGRNTAPADVLNFPDGFANVATKCDHGNRVYVSRTSDSGSTGRGIAVVPNDPTCAK